MNKKIMIVTIIAALMAVPVFAATTDQNQMDNDKGQPMAKQHQQMIQQAVDNGKITADEAVQMNEHMAQMAPIMDKMMQNGEMMKGMMNNSNMMEKCNNSK